MLGNLATEIALRKIDAKERRETVTAPAHYDKPELWGTVRRPRMYREKESLLAQLSQGLGFVNRDATHNGEELKRKDYYPKVPNVVSSKKREKYVEKFREFGWKQYYEQYPDMVDVHEAMKNKDEEMIDWYEKDWEYKGYMCNEELLMKEV